MNINDDHTKTNSNMNDLFFKRTCLELAKLLRTEQTEDFLHLYDSLPSEWNGTRVSKMIAVCVRAFSRLK
jgi:hypothetical protein